MVRRLAWMKLNKHKSKELAQKIVYYLIIFFGFIFRKLNYATTVQLAAWLGDLFFNVVKIRRQLVLQNLAMVFPARREKEIRQLARQVYRNQAENLLDMLRLSSMRTSEDASKLLTIDTTEFLAKTTHVKKGAVLVSAHFSNWELLARSIGLLVTPLHVVVKRLRNSFVDQKINQWRAECGNHVIYKNAAFREGIRMLQKGGVLSFLGDQSDPKGTFFMDFLGRRTSVFVGPAYIALKAEVPLFVVMGYRLGNGGYKAELQEIDMNGLQATKQDAEELVRRYTAVVERYIYQYPAEWFWFHDRWKRVG
uniref:Acyltransferase, HtrB/MsbB family n=1 Tax=Chlorobium chlorochromatii (strain CaD3) TaxID=340177 RepID=Q3AQI6_CHLCH